MHPYNPALSQHYPGHGVSVAVFLEPNQKPRYVVSSVGIQTMVQKKDGSVNRLPGSNADRTAGQFVQQWTDNNVEGDYRLLTSLEVIMLAALQPELFHIVQLRKIRRVADEIRLRMEEYAKAIQEAIPDPQNGRPLNMYGQPAAVLS